MRTFRAFTYATVVMLVAALVPVTWYFRRKLRGDGDEEKKGDQEQGNQGDQEEGDGGDDAAEMAIAAT